MSRFETLESLTRVGLDVDPATKSAVERGLLIRELLRQPRFTVRSAAEQIVALTAVDAGWLDALTPSTVSEATWAAAGRVATELPDIFEALTDGRQPPPGWKDRVHDLVERFSPERP